jgi:Ca2+-binding EF-hand superfamily protein
MTNRSLAVGLGGAALLFFIATPVARAHDEGEVMFQKMDTNGDGKISADEWAAARKAMFKMMDTNGDGKISADEMQAAMEKQEKMMGKEGGKGMMTASEKMKMLDTNGDGSVSEEEFMSVGKTMFEKMDTNHDGYLTKAELKAGHEKMMQKMHASPGLQEPQGGKGAPGGKESQTPNK